MGYGSYGYGGLPPSSSSNLSALAPPFTVTSKPNSSPLVDVTEAPYGVNLSSSLHNWLSSNYSNSGPGFFSSHNSEFNPLPSTTAFSPAGLPDIKPYCAHVPPVPVASDSADAFFYGHCSDATVSSLPEDVRCFPKYPSPAIQDHGPLVAPDETKYDCFSSSNIATMGSSSNNDDSRSSLAYPADWGEWWNRLGDWEHAKPVEPEGSFYGKGIYRNYSTHGGYGYNSSSSCEESSHIIDMMAWESHSGCASKEQSNDKAFLAKNPVILPPDYSKRSCLGSASLIPENDANAPASYRNCQVPLHASYDKYMGQHDASLSGPSFLTSSPSLVVRPPNVEASLSAPSKGPLKDVNFGSSAADSEFFGNNSSSVNEICPLLNSDGKDHFDTNQVNIHLDRNDPLSVKSFSAKNEKLPKEKSVPEEIFDQVFKEKSALQISHANSECFNLALDFIEAINPVENSSESFDHYNPSVDSPCWKGAPVSCFAPVKSSEAASSQYMKNMGSYNSLYLQVPRVCPLSTDETIKISLESPNEKTVSVERSSSSSSKSPSNANSSLTEPEVDDSAKGGSFHSKSSRVYELQHSLKSCEPKKEHAILNKSRGDSDFKPLLSIQQNFEASKMASEKECLSKTCVPDLQSIYDTGNGVSLLSSVEDTSSKLTKLHEADSTPKIDVQMLVNTLRSLSDVLLFHASNDSLLLKEGDREILEDVIFNLGQCILKNEKQRIPIQESQFPQHSTSQDLEELPKLPEEASVERPSLRREAAVIAQDQLNHLHVHAEKHHDIDPGHKMEVVSDSISLKGAMAKEDNMTQAIMKVLSENFDDEEETPPQSLLYKNLWLEAEAELCSINYKARYKRMKTEMEKSSSYKGKENAIDVEENLRSMVSDDLKTVDKLAPAAKGGTSSDIPDHCTASPPDIIARYKILRERSDYSNSAAHLEELSGSKVYDDMDEVDKFSSEAVEGKSLTHDSSISTTCYEDDIIARFQILKRLVDHSSSIKATDGEESLRSSVFPDNSFAKLSSSLKATDGEESSRSSVSPDGNSVDILAHEATEPMAALTSDTSAQNSPSLIPYTSAQNSPLSIPDTAAHDSPFSITDSSVQNSSFSSAGYYADDVASIMDRFNILTRRDEHLRSLEIESQEVPEFGHLEFAGEGAHGPTIQDRSGYGRVKEFPEHADDPVIQSCQSNKHGDPLPAGSHDSTSSDWEHVMKEELLG